MQFKIKGLSIKGERKTEDNENELHKTSDTILIKEGVIVNKIEILDNLINFSYSEDTVWTQNWRL